MTCLNCGKELEHIEDYGEYYYCPDCLDYAYDEDGEAIGRLE